MFQHQGIWLPDGERHFPEWMDENGEIVDGRGTYQIKKWRACLPWIRNRRTAVDVGAHVGFWSIQMGTNFEYVHAFEPIAAFRECWMKNAIGAVIYPYALGKTVGKVSMNYNPADSGNTHVAAHGGDVEMITLDSFAGCSTYPFHGVDFLKIDCEGYEHHVVEGGRETIREFKPCIIVEQKQHKMAQNYGTKGTPAVDLLESMGYVVRQKISGDYIMTMGG